MQVSVGNLKKQNALVGAIVLRKGELWVCVQETAHGGRFVLFYCRERTDNEIGCEELLINSYGEITNEEPLLLQTGIDRQFAVAMGGKAYVELADRFPEIRRWSWTPPAMKVPK